MSLVIIAGKLEPGLEQHLELYADHYVRKHEDVIPEGFDHFYALRANREWSLFVAMGSVPQDTREYLVADKLGTLDELMAAIRATVVSWAIAHAAKDHTPSREERFRELVKTYLGSDSTHVNAAMLTWSFKDTYPEADYVGLQNAAQSFLQLLEAEGVMERVPGDANPPFYRATKK